MSVVFAQSLQSQIETLGSLNLILMIVFGALFLIWYVQSRKKINRNLQKHLIDTLAKHHEPELRELTMNELLEIEENLLALKELYHSQLISADVYIHETLKYARKVQV
jgi:hypothetical protein